MCEDARNAIVEEIEKKYGRLIRKVAYEVLHDSHEVEDIIQSVLWNLISRHMDKLGEKDFKGYLCTAVRNAAINEYRRRENGAVCVDSVDLSKLTEQQIDTAAFCDNQGFGVELEEVFGVELEEVLNQLDYIDKDIICLHYGDGYTYAEIAPVVGMSDSAVRKRAERALKKLEVMLLEKEVKNDDK